ncbi:MAG: 50S ribosomal protein L18 [Phycisphaerales bacterium]|nr:50S ribosomal protein L18 [Phycisphaerales bacterium]
MNKNQHKSNKRSRRRAQIRRSVVGGPERPRLAVYKSLNHIYAQVIDDLAGKTLLAASTRDKDLGADKTGNVAAAAAVGKRLADKAKAAGVSKVVFDRSGFRYHGRIKALADAARKGGLDF